MADTITLDEFERLQFGAPSPSSGPDTITLDEFERLLFQDGEQHATWGDFGRQVAQGATFGFADEIEAGARSLGGADYRDTLKSIRDENDAYVKNNPLTAAGANIVGGLPAAFFPGMALARAAQGVGAATKAGAGLNAAARLVSPQAVPKGANAVWHGVKEGARLGGVYGGAYGAGAAEGNAIDTAQGAAGGAALGVATGAVAAPIFTALGSGLRAGGRVLAEGAEDRATRRVAQAFNEDGADAFQVMNTVFPRRQGNSLPQGQKNALLMAFANRGGRSVDDIAAEVGVSPRTVSSYFRQWNEQTTGNRNVIDMIAEAGGDATALQRRAETAIAVSPEGASVGAGRFADRQAQHGPRLVNAVRDETGGSGNAVRRIAQMGDDLKAWAGDDYDTLRGYQPVRVFTEAEKNSPAARAIAQLREQPEFNALEKDVRRMMSFRNGEAAPENVFDFDTLNEVQKSLREGSVISPMMDAQARRSAAFYGDMRERLLDAMEGHFENVGSLINPQAPRVSFRDIRTRYRQGSEALRAANTGMDTALSDSRKSRELFEGFAQRTATGEASADEVNAFRQTFGDELIRRVEREPAHRNAAMQFSSPGVERKLREALGEDAGSRLASLMKRESDQISRVNEMTKGSPTARRLLGADQMSADADVAANMLSGNPLGMLSAVSRFIRGDLTEREARELADMLTRMDEKQVIQLLNNVGKIQGNIQRGSDAITIRAGGAAAAIAGLVAQRQAYKAPESQR